ncbi:hypothetical protein [Asanoa iriomotensis]|uniref:DUF4352 domain-containing protein n=1 Tax=Asanoa iriomotensis TaxID=234613 RepID=A0ABQ4BX96_9ACTN|nr:hypothetical protein [Asanoa iriomotensis]GIF54685.1 hypothetical protein Air01nite_07800 [Asanoa iriomotensis]
MLRTALSLALLAPALPVAAAPAAAAQPDASQVDVAVTSTGHRDAEYHVVVRNFTAAPTELSVRQSIPDGAGVTATNPAPGPGGSPGPGSPNEIVWPVRLGPYEATTLTATFTPAHGGTPVSGAACAYVGLAGEPIDCAASVWTPAGPAVLDPQPEPWWRHWWVPVLGMLLVAATVLFVRYGWPRAAARVTALTDRGRAGVAVVTALVLLAGLGVLVVALGLPKLASATSETAQRGPGSGWIGPTSSGALGTPLRENAFEFTAYRFVCVPEGSGQRCTAVVGLTNRSTTPEFWHPHLQRLAVAGDLAVHTDEMATRAANGGRDVFAAPLAPGDQRLAQVSWAIPAGATPTMIELHSGAFANGVRVRV